MPTKGDTYLGPWINWRFGVIHGSTLTLPSRDGALLLAFVALFVALAANAIWRIAAFGIHQIRATPVDHDGLHHQHQIILRMTGSPAKAAWEFLRLQYYWRKRADKSFLRSLGMVFLALFCLAIVGVAGVFSARWVGAYGQETLIVSDNCGYWSTFGDESTTNYAALSLKTSQDVLAADTYARQCYGTDQNQALCSQYYKKQLTWDINTNASCPFSSEICSTTASPIAMDTGLLNSFDDLGWNTPISQRVEWRKKTSCAVLERGNYHTSVNVTNEDISDKGEYSGIGLPGDIVDLWNYGIKVNISNFTYSWNHHTEIDQIGYAVNALMYEPTAQDNSWIPVDALRRDDADESIIFLNANAVLYDGPNNDPIFLANQSAPQIGDSIWTHYYGTTVMACSDQYQYCNPNNGQCTNLSGWSNTNHFNIGMNPVQFRIMEIINLELLWTNVYETINGRGASALRAQDLESNLQSQGLPDDQWTIELNSWFATSLARIQRGMQQYATGPSNVSGDVDIVHPTDTIGKALCYSQMVPAASDTISFSIANLSVVLIVAAILIITNGFVDTAVGFIQRRRNPRSPRRLQWIMDEKLQLQRMAFEEAGMGEWTGGADTVPVTTRREKFGAIPGHVDVQHPRLQGRQEDGVTGETETFLGQSDREGKTGVAEVHSVAGS